MTSSPPVDGRRLRRDASRQRIVEAMIALVRDGVLVPTAEQVAERAGLTMRTVFRHFADMDSLFREISNRIYDESKAFFAVDVPEGDWVDALHSMIDRRARIYEKLYPMRVAADAMRHRSPFLQKDHQAYVAMIRRALVELLPEQAAEDALFVEAVDGLLSFEFWNRLRRDQRLSAARATAVLHGAVTNLIQGSLLAKPSGRKSRAAAT